MKGGIPLARKPKDTAYLALSAFLRSRERTLLTQSRRERMLQAPTVAESAQVLAELGYPAFDTYSEEWLNEALARRREETFAEVSGMIPDGAIVDVFRLKYDYHNIKTILKSRGSDVASLLVDAGCVSAGDMLTRFQQTGKWDHLPPDMAAAATEAQRVLAETGDPQRSDFLLDRACFARMLALAEGTGCELLRDHVRLQIDAANLRSLVRARRMRRSGAFLQQVLFPGGGVSVNRILAGASGGGADVYRGTALQEAAELGDEAAAGGSLTAFERSCDNALLALAARARSVPFGPEVAVGYLAARENEWTAARIILTGRAAGLDADAIRERLRDSYV